MLYALQSKHRTEHRRALSSVPRIVQDERTLKSPLDFVHRGYFVRSLTETCKTHFIERRSWKGQNKLLAWQGKNEKGVQWNSGTESPMANICSDLCPSLDDKRRLLHLHFRVCPVWSMTCCLLGTLLKCPTYKNWVYITLPYRKVHRCKKARERPASEEQYKGNPETGRLTTIYLGPAIYFTVAVTVFKGQDSTTQGHSPVHSSDMRKPEKQVLTLCDQSWCVSYIPSLYALPAPHYLNLPSNSTLCLDSLHLEQPLLLLNS